MSGPLNRVRAWRGGGRALGLLLVAGMALGLCVTGAASASAARVSPCTFPSFFGSLTAVPRGATVLSRTEVPVCTTGRITIAFAGDLAGCVSPGMCHYSGADTWQPGSGVLTIVVFKVRGRRLTEGWLTFYGDYPLRADVQHAIPGSPATTCRDSAQTYPSLTERVPRGAIAISLRGGFPPLLGTRCAGPLEPDIASALPFGTLSLRQVLRGAASTDLTSTRAFSAHGLTGTVTSTVRLRSGRSEPGLDGGPEPPAPPLKEVIALYRLDRVSGAIQSNWTGTGAGCGPLDTCQASGTLALLPHPANGALVSFSSIGSPRRPDRDFLAALHLTTHGNSHGISVGGGVNWDEKGSVTESAGACTDRIRLTRSAFGLESRAGRLVGFYTPVTQAADPLRTRCPGPSLGIDGTFTSAPLPLRALARRTLTLRLASPTSRTFSAFHLRTQSTLAITITRTRIIHRLIGP